MIYVFTKIKTRDLCYDLIFCSFLTDFDINLHFLSIYHSINVTNIQRSITPQNSFSDLSSSGFVFLILDSEEREEIIGFTMMYDFLFSFCV